MLGGFYLPSLHSVSLCAYSEHFSIENRKKVDVILMTLYLYLVFLRQLSKTSCLSCARSSLSTFTEKLPSSSYLFSNARVKLRSLYKNCHGYLPLVYTATIKINRPGHNIHVLNEFLTADRSFEKILREVCSPHLYASFGTFCVQIGQLFAAQ